MWRSRGKIPDIPVLLRHLKVPQCVWVGVTVPEKVGSHGVLTPTHVAARCYIHTVHIADTGTEHEKINPWWLDNKKREFG